MSFSTLLQSLWKDFHGDPLNSLHNWLFCFINIDRMCFVYFAFDVAPKELTTSCKIRREWGGWCLQNEKWVCLEILSWEFACKSVVWTLAAFRWNRSKSSLKCNSFHGNFSNMTTYRTALTVAVRPSSVPKKQPVVPLVGIPQHAVTFPLCKGH